MKIDFNNRPRTQSPRVMARRTVLTTVLKHALLSAAIISSFRKYHPAKCAVKERSEGRAKMSNKYESRRVPAPRRVAPHRLFSSEQAFCINFLREKKRTSTGYSPALCRARARKSVCRQAGLLHIQDTGVTAAAVTDADADGDAGARPFSDAARKRRRRQSEGGGRESMRGREKRREGESGWKWALWLFRLWSWINLPGIRAYVPQPTLRHDAPSRAQPALWIHTYTRAHTQAGSKLSSVRSRIVTRTFAPARTHVHQPIDVTMNLRENLPSPIHTPPPGPSRTERRNPAAASYPTL